MFFYEIIRLFQKCLNEFKRTSDNASLLQGVLPLIRNSTFTVVIIKLAGLGDKISPIKLRTLITAQHFKPDSCRFNRYLVPPPPPWSSQTNIFYSIGHHSYTAHQFKRDSRSYSHYQDYPPPLWSSSHSRGHSNIALLLDLHKYAEFRHNRSNGSGSNLTCKILSKHRN